VHDSVREHARTAWSESVWQQLVQGIRFVSGNHDDPAAFAQLKKVVDELDEQRGTAGNHTFYLSIPPRDFPIVLEQLNNSGLTKAGAGEFRRVVIEKPFGSDLKTAIELNDLVERVFPPDSVFRIDHYLGKETVQNILALRFANQLFEPIWNSEFIDHVQITMAEDIGIGGRAGYYDGIGAARDVIQNHLLQLFALTAMEQPASFNAENLRSAKEAALSDVRIPENLALYSAHGQYESGWQGGEYVNSYLEEEGTDPHSRTETFAAMRLDVDNPRWHGTPFYLRAGKRLGRRVTEIAVVFKRPSHQLFSQDEVSQLGENALVIRVQPNEGVTIRFGSKVPGPAMQVRDVTMDFGYGHAFTEDSPEAYERLILDVLLGEPPLFPRQREVELSWKILDPIVQFWESDGRNDKYAPGSWGPESAHEIMRADGRSWRRP
jgi:glucose-6-phosphate 1-dehydrogenase